MKRRSGFTLIEVLIVLVILAILAAIVLPRLLGAGREAREADLKSHLQEMRNAVGLFSNDVGCCPARLQDIVATTAPAVGAEGQKIDPKKFKGPYLATSGGELPANPINGSNEVGTAGATRTTDHVGWTYDPETGTIHPESGWAVNGTDYSTW